MNRLRTALSARGRGALIAFLVAGDPDSSASVAYARAVIEAGADVLELAMPFSDPVADGPVIQRADERALAAGMTPDRLFALIREIRGFSEIPIVILSYFNIVFARGVNRFYQEASEAGVDGILIVDLPLEESDEAVQASRLQGIEPIFLVAESTSEARLKQIASRAGGFLYLVSTSGVTGMREDLFPHMVERITRVRAVSSLPVVVGFGISRPTQVRFLRESGADGVIVGSAVVQQIEKHGADVGKGCAAVREYLREMRQALE